MSIGAVSSTNSQLLGFDPDGRGVGNMVHPRQ
jgi:hypothetical protein